MSGNDLPEKALAERLQALKQAMENAVAPERVEASLVAAFRERAARPAVRSWPRWVLAAAVVVLVAGLAVFLNLRTAPTQPVVVAQRQPAPATEPSKVIADTARAVPRPVRPRAGARGVAAEFIPLVPDLTWGRGDSAQMMRVSLPRTALQSFGLPVDENRAFETVRADIIVGQDMVVRAIRIVR